MKEIICFYRLRVKDGNDSKIACEGTLEECSAAGDAFVKEGKEIRISRVLKEKEKSHD